MVVKKFNFLTKLLVKIKLTIFFLANAFIFVDFSNISLSCILFQEYFKNFIFCEYAVFVLLQF
jgi:hypothetical protein